MQKILSYIENKKHEFSSLPFFSYLKDEKISTRDRLAFTPFASTFIMSFGDINKYVLREENTTDKLQLIINQHTYEDDHHWKWFLEDIKKLNYDRQVNFSSTLKFLWDENNYAGRKLVNEIYRYSYQATSIIKLIIIEVLEATGNVLFSTVEPIAEQLAKETGQNFIYFGKHHLAVETGHTTGIEDVDCFLKDLSLSESDEREAIRIIDDLFLSFSNFTNELMHFSIQVNHSPNNLSGIFCKNFEYLIIGAGPAGLQLGYYLEKSNRNYAILEAGNAPGTFFKKYPRHRKLISINKRHTGYDDAEINLRWDWNSLLSDSEEMLFKNYSHKYFPDADSLVEYLGDYANHFDLNIEYGVKVTKITKDEQFIVTDQKGNFYSCKHLVIATGCQKLYLPEIAGIELAEKYTEVSVDPNNFENQRVLIIGKGNSAFETADNLIDTAATIHVCSPTPVTMAWRTKYVGHLRAVNNNFLDTYQLKSQNAILDANIKNIKKEDGEYIVSVEYSHANGECEDLAYDRVILCTGFRFDNSIFDEQCKPDLTINNRYPAQTSEWESTNIKDLYFAGILMHMRDFKEKQSGFIHGFRYNIRTLHRILEYKNHQIPLPSQQIGCSPKAITDFIIRRVNTSSSLWQQTDFMCDLITISENKSEVLYYDELTKDFIHEGALSQHEHYYTISLEFGKNVEHVADPFSIDRVHKEDAFNSSDSEFIHPVIRRFHKSTLIAEHHVIEDLASEWKEEVHIQPLLKFITEQLTHSQGIGAHLLEAGLLTSEQLEVALAEQELEATARLGEVIQKRGWVKERTIQFLLNQVNKTLVDDPDLSTGARLGAYLVEAGLVTSTQVDQALLEQKTSNKHLGEILVTHGWVTTQTIEYMMKYLSNPNVTAKPKAAVLN